MTMTTDIAEGSYHLIQPSTLSTFLSAVSNSSQWSLKKLGQSYKTMKKALLSGLNRIYY
jgi:hypothetical protein